MSTQDELTNEQNQSRIPDITNYYTYYMGTPGTKMYGFAGYHDNLELIHGPNTHYMFSEPQLANIRTGQIGERTHHCGLKESHNHKPGPGCIPKGHFSKESTQQDERKNAKVSIACCPQFKTINGRRVRCGIRYLIWSTKGCPDCGNRPGTMAKVIEDLFEGHIYEVDWEVFNDPDRNLIYHHQESTEQVDLAEIVVKNSEKLEEWLNSDKAQIEEVPTNLLTPWALYTQADMEDQQQSRLDKARAKRIQALTNSIVDQETQKAVATKKTKRMQPEDPMAVAKLHQDALQTATAQVIAEDLQAQQPVIPLSRRAQARLDRRRGMEAKFAFGGSGASKLKGGNKKPTPEAEEQPTDKKNKKGKKPKRGKENQPPA